MRKILFSLFAILLLILPSCTTYKLVLPVGSWQSDNPSISFDATGEGRRHYGTYTKDGEEVKIIIIFSHLNNRFRIYDNVIGDENFNESMSDYEYFCGEFKAEDDKIYYTLLPTWQEMHGVEEIIFTKVVD